jgi:hypothetical protein
MRRADVRKLLENVGVRFQTAGRAFALGEEREAVIDHVVSEDAAVGIRRRLRRIETQHVGQCAPLSISAIASSREKFCEARAQFGFNVTRKNSLTDCVAAAVAAEL